MKSFLCLAGGSLASWALLLGPGWLIQGQQVLCQSLTALGLCLVPALVSLVWIQNVKKSPEMQLAAVLGGGGIRMAVCLGGAVALYHYIPEVFPTSFLLWVGILYMIVLALEVVLVVRGKTISEQRELAGTVGSAR